VAGGEGRGTREKCSSVEGRERKAESRERTVELRERRGVEFFSVF